MKMKGRTSLLIVLAVVSCFLLLQYHYYIISFNSTPEKLVIKHILYWTKMFGREDFYLGTGSEIFEGCEVRNCYATSNRSYLPVDQFAAILFHANEYEEGEMDEPEKRFLDQYYIYFNQESPIHTRQSRSDGFFNWTMTYRTDSDIPRPYGYFEKINTNYSMPTVEAVKRKPHKIAWMVSNCGAPSDRSTLYEKLNKYIPVDVYGSCGNKSCPRDEFDKCYDLLATNYKFYLSFENSICWEYVTEKLYAALMRDIVPIVYGGADYTKVAPPNSVIDVTKFNSVKELAEYIKILDENPEKYLSYFEWKKEYIVKRNSKPTLCTLCQKLNEPIIPQCYNNIPKWWAEGMCKIGSKLPKILFT